MAGYLAAHAGKTVQLPLPSHPYDPGVEYFLGMEATTRYATDLIPVLRGLAGRG